MDEETRNELQGQLQRIYAVIEAARSVLNTQGTGPIDKDNAKRIIKEAQRKRDELEERLATGDKS